MAWDQAGVVQCQDQLRLEGMSQWDVSSSVNDVIGCNWSVWTDWKRWITPVIAVFLCRLVLSLQYRIFCPTTVRFGILFFQVTWKRRKQLVPAIATAVPQQCLREQSGMSPFHLQKKYISTAPLIIYIRLLYLLSFSFCPTVIHIGNLTNSLPN